ncbi:hypothetical protein F5Y03DRAFT_395655 [Xylaria venustula]|nr:hypothetical protein F5Y03DRAFT_395655 [Xylaria venustula]
MSLNIEELLDDFDVTFVDGLWIALVAVEAAILLCVLGHRVFGCDASASITGSELWS